MASSWSLSKIPVLRILVPFVLGILAHRLCHCWWASISLMALAVCIYLLLITLSKTPEGRLRWRSFFIIPLAMAAMSLGWFSAIIHCPPQLSAEQRTGRLITGRIVNLDYTDFSMRLTMDVLEPELPPCKVLVSTRGCDYTLNAGDLLAWQASLNEVSTLGNPMEMDYAAYLLDSKGIRYQQHLPLSQIRKVGHSPTLVTSMAKIRRELQLMVFNSQLSASAQQFIVTMLLGNSSFIDKATRQEFSSAGVAHVLALSGLHIGFITLIIWWMLFPLDYLRLKKLRLAITLAVIVLFAVFTGLSPSVVRATVMIAMVFAAFIFYRRSTSLNALALAALLILIFSPSALFSVGFELSFITVGAILMFARVPKSLESRYRWVNNLTATVITSLVAMLATVALTAHYFHTVSFMSVLANLLILPVLPVLIVLGALFLLVTAAGMHWPVLDAAIDALYRYIHGAVTATNTLPLSHIGGVYVSTAGVVAFFVAMALFILWIYQRNHRYLLAAGVVLALLLVHSLWLDYSTPRRGAVIFNSFTSTPVLYYDHDKAYIWTPDDEEVDSAAFARYHSGFLALHNINQLQFVADEDTVRLGETLFRPPHAFIMGHRIMAVGSGKWKSSTSNHRLKLDDIIVTKRFHGTVAKLKELYDFERLIISGAHYDSSILLHECDSLGIKVIDLNTQGAIIF